MTRFDVFVLGIYTGYAVLTAARLLVDYWTRKGWL